MTDIPYAACWLPWKVWCFLGQLLSWWCWNEQVIDEDAKEMSMILKWGFAKKMPFGARSRRAFQEFHTLLVNCDTQVNNHGMAHGLQNFGLGQISFVRQSKHRAKSEKIWNLNCGLPEMVLKCLFSAVKDQAVSAAGWPLVSYLSTIFGGKLCVWLFSSSSNNFF